MSQPDDLHARAVALYDRFTHEAGDRRAFMRDMAVLAGSVAAAETLLLGIAANPAAAAVIAPQDPRLKVQEVAWAGSNKRRMRGYSARPAGRATKRGTVMVIHENRGLTDHIRDVARRVALAGFIAVAPDFLSPDGGTPANEDAARDAIGKLELATAVADGVATIGWLRRVAQSNGRVGVVGFCWGGAMVNRLAVAAGPALSAGVAYYGPAPAPAEAAKVEASMMLHYAKLDARVNATGLPWADALKANNVPTESFVYEGVNHAFHNDTAVGRYDKEAAELSWSRTLAFLETRLS